MGAMINEDRFGVLTISLDVASVAINTSAEQTFTIPGLKVGDFVAVNKPSLTAGLGVTNARVSAANTLALTFTNATAGAIDPAAETYAVFWFRPEKTVSGVVNP
jgi:bifunctional pyridoxal-dependent enzyme with beta-cystathionase and maltose regulon repressor activities